MESVPYEEEALNLIALQKYGHVRDALTLAETITLAGPITETTVRKHLKLDLDDRAAELLLQSGTDWDETLLQIERMTEDNSPEDLWSGVLRAIKKAELIRLSPNRATTDKSLQLVERFGPRLQVSAEWAFVQGERFYVRSSDDLAVSIAILREQLGANKIESTGKAVIKHGEPRNRQVQQRRTQTTTEFARNLSLVPEQEV